MATTKPTSKQSPDVEPVAPQKGSNAALWLVIGCVCVGVGGWLFINNIQVRGGVLQVAGQSYLYLALVPILIGVGLLAFRGTSAVAWFLLFSGLLCLIVGVLLRMRFYFRPTTLGKTLLMLGLFAVGVGMVARAIAEARKSKPPTEPKREQ